MRRILVALAWPESWLAGWNPAGNLAEWLACVDAAQEVADCFPEEYRTEGESNNRCAAIQ